jgi:hypothetical protein
LRQRWCDLFNASFDVLLYDLTSTYFESDPPADPQDKRRFGYSRDKRFDCVQVVIALIVTPEGFPLAYQVMAGNTSDKTTLADWLKRIEKQDGKARRIWVMDRGIPTEEVLEPMRQSDPPVQYLVGTPKGRRLRDLAPGLTARAVLEKFAAVQMLDVRIPTSDIREVLLTRYTQPKLELQLLLSQLKLELPAQPPPKISSQNHGHQLKSV